MNGLADPAVLDHFLEGLCTYDTQGTQICDGYLALSQAADPMVDLRRLPHFVSGNLDIVADKPGLAGIRDSLAQSGPVLIALALTAGGAPPAHILS